MPQQQRASSAAVQPSRGLLSRWFGSDELTPEMQEGINIARREIPDLAPVKPYGFFSRMLTPKADAYVSPGNSIYMNPAANMGRSPQEIADIITHEQEHVKQQRQSPYGATGQLLRRIIPSNTPYAERPEEMAAFQAEKERRYRMGRPQMPIPSMTGQAYVPQDINLPRRIR